MKGFVPLPARDIFSLGLALVLFSLLLSACGIAEVDITVYSDNRYKQEITISFSADSVEMAGGIPAIETQLDEIVTDGAAEGVDIRWRRLETKQSNVIKYEILIALRDMTNAETQGFTWKEISYNQRKAYRFEYSEYVTLRGGMQSFTLTLHAGKILESNGTKIDAHTVRWVNPNQMPYAIVQPKSSVNWILLVVALLVLFGTSGALLYLYFKGHLKDWIAAGFSASKWRVQAIKLGTDRTRMEKDRSKLVADLGAKAWEARVVHPNYALLYGQLELLEQQRTTLGQQIQAAEQRLNQVRQTRSTTDTDFITRINKLVEERKAKTASLGQVRTELTAAEKRLAKARTDLDKTDTEIKSLQGRLDQAQASTAADKETQLASLSNAIAALNQSLTQLLSEVPHIESEIARFQTEQQPLSDDVNRLEQQISQLQAAHREALAPLDQEISKLQAEIRTSREQQAAQVQQMTPLITNLGPEVDRARPAAAALSGAYDRLDQVDQDLGGLSQQNDLLMARLGAADTGAIQKFYIGIGAVVLAFILVVVLLVIAF